jgi:hypothetical protein
VVQLISAFALSMMRCATWLIVGAMSSPLLDVKITSTQ